ncbi:hypothetical protein K435DRAFT_973082, partial [Dendrothele bispora CBS 962.96]
MLPLWFCYWAYTYRPHITSSSSNIFAVGLHSTHLLHLMCTFGPCYPRLFNSVNAIFECIVQYPDNIYHPHPVHLLFLAAIDPHIVCLIRFKWERGGMVEEWEVFWGKQSSPREWREGWNGWERNRESGTPSSIWIFSSCNTLVFYLLYIRTLNIIIRYQFFHHQIRPSHSFPL